MEATPDIKRRRTPREMAALRDKLLAHLKAGGSPHEFAEANNVGERYGQLYKLIHKLGWEPMYLSKKERELILKRRAK